MRVIGLPLDSEGRRADALMQALAENRPKLSYALPTFHNPTGSVISGARRREVIALAHRYSVPVLENDRVREVRCGSPVPPPLATLDTHGMVIHCGSFTKSLSPALLLGYIAARGPLRARLATVKRAADLFSSTLPRRAVQRYLDSGAIRKLWKHVSLVYRRGHAAMLSALERYFPPSATWVGVEGGLVMWTRVLPGASVAARFERALAENVTFVTGATFYPEPADQPFLRLNFAALDESRIDHGAAVLGRLLGSTPALSHGAGQGTRTSRPTAGCDEVGDPFARGGDRGADTASWDDGTHC